MNIKIVSLILLPLFVFTSCDNNTTVGDKNEIANGNHKTGVLKNFLRMKINGKEWRADSEIFGVFHPPGYNDAIILSGSKGPNDKNEQTFNINLYNTSGPAVFNVETGNTNNSVIQLAGLSEEHFLYGSMMGFKVKVNITKASQNPTIIEATFEGELAGDASDKLIITEGQFYYHE